MDEITSDEDLKLKRKETDNKLISTLKEITINKTTLNPIPNEREPVMEVLDDGELSQSNSKDDLEKKVNFDKRAEELTDSNYPKKLESVKIKKQTDQDLIEEYTNNAPEVRTKYNRILTALDRVSSGSGKLRNSVTANKNKVIEGIKNTIIASTDEKAIKRTGFEQVIDKSKLLREFLKDTVEKKRSLNQLSRLSIIGNELGTINKFNLKATSLYQKKSLELKFRSLFLQKSLNEKIKDDFNIFKTQLEAIVHNTALPDFAKIKQSETFRQQLRQTAVEKLQERLKAGAQTAFEKFKESSFAQDRIVGFQSKLDRLAGGLDAYYASEEDNEGLPGAKSRVAGIAAGIFGRGGKNSVIQETGEFNLNKEVGFDNKTKTSIIKVIPGFLSKILKEVISLRTGENTEEVRYDYAKGVFSTKGTIQKKVADQVNFLFKQNKSEGYINNLVDRITEDGDFTDSEKKEIFSALLKHSFNNKNLGVKNFLNKDVDKLISNKDTQDKVKAKLEGIASDEGERVDFNRQILEARKEIPGVNRAITGLIKTGHLEDLKDTGIITYDDALGKYRINKDKQIELLQKYSSKSSGVEILAGIKPSKIGKPKTAKESIKEEIKDDIKDIIGDTVEDIKRTTDAFRPKQKLGPKAGKISDITAEDIFKDEEEAIEKPVKKRVVNPFAFKQTLRPGSTAKETEVTQESIESPTLNKKFKLDYKKFNGPLPEINDIFSKTSEKLKEEASNIEEVSVKLKDGLKDYVQATVNLGLGKQTEQVAETASRIKEPTVDKELGYRDILESIDNKLDNLEAIKELTNVQVDYQDANLVSLDELKEVTALLATGGNGEKLPASFSGLAKQYIRKKYNAVKAIGKSTFNLAKLPFKFSTFLGKKLLGTFGKTFKGIWKVGSFINKVGERLIDSATKTFKSLFKPVKTVLGFTGSALKGISNLLFGEKGLLTRTIKGLKKGAGKMIKDIKAVAGFTKHLLFGDRARPIDVYIYGKPEPVLRANIMKMGLYIDKTTGEVIKSLKDINGEVLDSEGNVVLSISDIKNGVFDKNGNELKLGKANKTGAVIAASKKIFSGIKKTYKAGSDVGKWAARKILKIKDKKDIDSEEDELDLNAGLGAKGKSGKSFKGKAKESGSVIGEMITQQKQTNTWLEKIHGLIKKITPDYSPFDKDKSGARDGSWKDRLKALNKKDNDDKKETGKEKEDKEGFSFMKLLGFIGPIVGGLMSMVGGGISSLLTTLGLGGMAFTAALAKLKSKIFPSGKGPGFMKKMWSKLTGKALPKEGSKLVEKASKAGFLSKMLKFLNPKTIAKSKGGKASLFLGSAYAIKKFFFGDEEEQMDDVKQEYPDDDFSGTDVNLEDNKPVELDTTTNTIGLGAGGLIASKAILDTKKKLADKNRRNKLSVSTKQQIGPKVVEALDADRNIRQEIKKEPVIKSKPRASIDRDKIRAAKETRHSEALTANKKSGGWFSNLIDKIKSGVGRIKDVLVSKFPVLGKLGGSIMGFASKFFNNDMLKKLLSKVSFSSLKSIAKKLPGVGALFGLFFAAKRAMAGDFTGAGAELVSGLASIVPGIGTASSLGIDYWLAKRDAAVAGTETGSDLADVSLAGGAASLLLGKKAGMLGKLGRGVGQTVGYGATTGRLIAQEMEGGIYDDEGRYRGLEQKEPRESQRRQNRVKGNKKSKLITLQDIKKINLDKISLYRFIMYGAKPDNKKVILQFKNLEDYLFSITANNSFLAGGSLDEMNGEAEVLTGRELVEIMGIDLDPDDRDEMMVLEKWYDGRFLPVFKRHLKGIYFVIGKIEHFDILKKFTEKDLGYYAKIAWNLKGIDFSIEKIHNDGWFFDTELTTKGYVREYAPWDMVSIRVDDSIDFSPSPEKLEALRKELYGNKHSFKPANLPSDGNINNRRTLPRNNDDSDLKAISYSTVAGAAVSNRFNNILKTKYISPDAENETITSSAAGRKNKTTGSAKPGLIPLLATPLVSPEGGIENIKLKPGVSLDGLNKAVLDNLLSMANEYNRLTEGYILLTSGFRSYEQQAALKRKYGRRAASPGNSMHEFGFAFDIDPGTANQLEKLGLMRKYGFTRPVGGEPWHVEPAGIQTGLAYLRDKKKSWDDRQAWGEMMTKASIAKGGGGWGLISGVRKYSRNDAYAKALMSSSKSKILRLKDEYMPVSIPGDTSLLAEANSETFKTPDRNLKTTNVSPVIGNGKVAKNDVDGDGSFGLQSRANAGFIKTNIKKTQPGHVDFEIKPTGSVIQETGFVKNDETLNNMVSNIVSIDSTLKESLLVQKALLEIAKNKEESILINGQEQGLQRASTGGSTEIPKPGIDLKRKVT